MMPKDRLNVITIFGGCSTKASSDTHEQLYWHRHSEREP